MIYRLIKNFLKYVFAPLLAIAFIWIGYFIIFANFHKVDDDIFRSAQLRFFNMPYYIKKYGIKSILNLRGNNIDKPWYKVELEIADEYDIVHYDYGIGAREVRTLKEMKDIVKLIKEAPKPLLIHCKAGADRTGLAVALYLHEIKKNENADDALSILYGHFPWFGSKTVAMDKSFNIYKKEVQ